MLFWVVSQRPQEFARVPRDLWLEAFRIWGPGERTGLFFDGGGSCS